MIEKSGILKWEQKDSLGIIKISSGDSANSIPQPDFADPNVIKSWIEKDEVKAIILTGERRHFSAGANLEYFDKNKPTKEDILNQFGVGEEILKYLHDLEKPVVAAIDGVCLGAGLEIALSCHLRFCSKNAMFGFPEITHGIIPGHGGIQRMVDIVGKSKTLEIMLTGDTFNAEDAKKIGIINRIVDEKSCLDYAVEFINKVINMGSKPVAYSIRSVNNAGIMDYKTAIKEECKMFADLVIGKYNSEVQ